MALNDAALNVAAGAIRTAITHLSLHSSTPNSSGSNETTAARVAAGWGSVSGSGDFSTTNKAFTGVAANGAVTHIGFWSASTAGTFYGYVPATGDQTANSAGEYTVATVTVDGSAS